MDKGRGRGDGKLVVVRGRGEKGSIKRREGQLRGQHRGDNTHREDPADSSQG